MSRSRRGHLLEAGPPAPSPATAAGARRPPDAGRREGRTRTLGPLLDGLAERGERPALLALAEEGVEPVSFADLGRRVTRRARGLVRQGIGRGESVALLARPGVEWIVACLALLRAGAVPVPLDTQLGRDDLERIFEDCETLWIVADRRAAAGLEHVTHGCRVVLLDAGPEDPEPAEDDDDGDTGRPLPWSAWATDDDDDVSLPDLEPGDRALLFYTSGTTGPPKGVPLAHRHLAHQLDVVHEAGILAADEHLLVPLPLHHVYPLVIGVLAPLALGITVVLPLSLTGPQLRRALTEGEATALLGVPAIHAALLTGLDQRLDASAFPVRHILRGLLLACTLARRRLRVDLGGLLLRPVRRRVAPRLRLLLSGGSALPPEVGWRLRGLGWQVASGYGLTETAPLLTINPPDSPRPDSAGRPVAGIEVRIDPDAVPRTDEDEDEAGRRDAEPDEGEILVRGPSVFDGYLDLEEETAASFTDDGWFRTGDLGRLDGDGWLHVAGRKSTVIVTPSGENLRTEQVEERYAEHELVAEIGILSGESGLAAVVVPDRAALRARDRDGDEAEAEAVRQALAERASSLASYERIDEVVTSPAPLERTRLGKLKRHRLRERYDELRAGGDAAARRRRPVPLEEMTPADRELLADERGRAAWDLLARRFPEAGLSPDTSLRLDLGLDSLGWLDLGLALSEATGIELDEERLASLDTVRDLLEAVVEGPSGVGGAVADPLREPRAVLDARQERWLAPLSPGAARLARLLSGLNRSLLRALFRLEVQGAEELPRDGPLVLAPNHASYLDPFAVAAALPEPLRERTSWGGWTGVAFRNALLRGASRLARVVPVDPERAVASSLAFGALVLERGDHLVWFPEGRRSPSGELGPFRPGLGMLLAAHEEVTVVPVHLRGTHEAWPVGRALPRPGRVRVTFGAPVSPGELARSGEGDDDRDRITSALEARVRDLARRDR